MVLHIPQIAKMVTKIKRRFMSEVAQGFLYVTIKPATKYTVELILRC